MWKSHIESVLQTLTHTPRVKASRTWDRESHTEPPRTAIVASIVRLTIRYAMAQLIGTLALYPIKLSFDLDGSSRLTFVRRQRFLEKFPPSSSWIRRFGLRTSVPRYVWLALRDDPVEQRQYGS
jgi:hypothetical protein